MDASNLSDPGSPTDELRSSAIQPPGTSTKDQDKVMANLKDIVATLAILSAGTLTLTGCKKEGETTNPDEVEAGDSAGAADGGEGEGEASCEGDDAEASGSGEDAPADGGDAEEASGSGEDAPADGEASCSGAA